MKTWGRFLGRMLLGFLLGAFLSALLFLFVWESGVLWEFMAEETKAEIRRCLVRRYHPLDPPDPFSWTGHIMVSVVGLFGGIVISLLCGFLGSVQLRPGKISWFIGGLAGIIPGYLIGGVAFGVIKSLGLGILGLPLVYLSALAGPILGGILANNWAKWDDQTNLQ